MSGKRAATLLAVVLLLCGALGGVVLLNREPTSTFCYADGLIGPNGELYGRRSGDCRFVDEDGEVLTTTGRGEPLCYDPGMAVVDCGAPGIEAQPAEPSAQVSSPAEGATGMRLTSAYAWSRLH